MNYKVEIKTKGYTLVEAENEQEAINRAYEQADYFGEDIEVCNVIPMPETPKTVYVVFEMELTDDPDIPNKTSIFGIYTTSERAHQVAEDRSKHSSLYIYYVDKGEFYQ